MLRFSVWEVKIVKIKADTIILGQAEICHLHRSFGITTKKVENGVKKIKTRLEI
jgi:hypothetical protein